MKKKIIEGRLVPTKGPSTEPVAGITEIDFGITTEIVHGSHKSKYPLITGPGVKELVDRIIDLSNRFDAVADPFKAAKQELTAMGFPQFFDANDNKVNPASSMVAYGTKGGARVTFKDQYTAGDKAKLYALLTEPVAGKWFRQDWEIKIKSEEIPEEKAPGLITAIKEVMAKHGVLHALEIKAQIMPRPNFTSYRHTAFEPPVLGKINEIVPQRTSVTTKGVK